MSDPKLHSTTREPTATPNTDSTMRDLVRAHRGNPVLIEGLLFAHHVAAQRALPHFTLNLEAIIGIGQHQQRFRWLTPSGPSEISEFSRQPHFSLPEGLERDSLAHLSDATIIELLSNPQNAFERVYLSQAGAVPRLENLRAHPCEEVHLNYENVLQTDIAHLRQCETLKSLTVLEFDPEVLAPLAGHPSITHLDFHTVSKAQRSNKKLRRLYVKFLRTFPNLQSICVPCNPKNDPQGEEFLKYSMGQHALAEYIHDRKKYITFAKFNTYLCSDRVAIALGQCANLRTLILRDTVVHDKFIVHALRSPSVQRSLRHVELDNARGSASFSLTTGPRGSSLRALAKCTSLRHVALPGSKARTPEICAIVRGSKGALRRLHIGNCRLVRERVVDALLECPLLDRVDIAGTNVGPEAKEKFVQHRVNRGFGAGIHGGAANAMQGVVEEDEGESSASHGSDRNPDGLMESEDGGFRRTDDETVMDSSGFSEVGPDTDWGKSSESAGGHSDTESGDDGEPDWGKPAESVGKEAESEVDDDDESDWDAMSSTSYDSAYM